MLNKIGDARVLVGVGMDFESEEDFEFMDASESTPDYWDFHERQFGGRRGIWRLLDVLQRHQIDATFFICSALLHSYPRACRTIQRAGYEIAAHTVHHEHLDRMTEAEERAMFELQAKQFGDFGVETLGFRTCFPSDRTLDLVAEYGFFYDTTTRDDEFPYLMERSTGNYIEVPRGFNGDSPMAGGARRPRVRKNVETYWTPVINTGRYNASREVLETWKRELAWLHQSADSGTKMMSLCLHPYISGRPSRAWAVDEFLTYAKQFEGVKFVTHLDLARWALEISPEAAVHYEAADRAVGS